MSAMDHHRQQISGLIIMALLALVFAAIRHFWSHA